MAATTAPKGVPVLLIGTTSNFKMIYTATTSDPAPECPHLNYSIWTPTPASGYYPLGSYPVSGYNQPNTAVYTVSQQNQDPNNPLLIAPQDFTLVWTDPDPNTLFGDCQPNYTVSLWAVIPPPNYVALGMVATGVGFGGTPPKPDPSTIVCLRSDYAVPAAIGSQIYTGSGFNGEGPNGDSPATLWQVNGSLALYAQPNQSSPSGTWFNPNNLPAKLPGENK